MEEIVSRYAEALVSIAKEENKLEQYKNAVFDISEIFLCEPELLKYLTSYFVSFDEKVICINELCKPFELLNLNNFIKLLTKKHLIFKFKDIAQAINKNINEELNIYEGFVYSTEKLTNEKINEIEETISCKLKRKVELSNKIDSRLIGGIKVVVHDYVFDGSIKFKLENMKKDLLERRTTNEN